MVGIASLIMFAEDLFFLCFAEVRTNERVCQRTAGFFTHLSGEAASIARLHKEALIDKQLLSHSPRFTPAPGFLQLTPEEGECETCIEFVVWVGATPKLHLRNWESFSFQLCTSILKRLFIFTMWVRRVMFSRAGEMYSRLEFFSA